VTSYPEEKVQGLKEGSEKVTRIKKLIDGRKAKFYVNHEGVQQLMQWERNPIAKPFRKFVRKSMKKLMTTGTVSIDSMAHRRIALETKKVEQRERETELETMKFMNNLFPDDARMQFHIKERLTNCLAIEQPAYKTCTEVVESSGVKPWVVAKKKCSLGRQCARVWRAMGRGDILTTDKLVNGHQRPVKYYPVDFHEEIVSIWNEL